MHVANEWGWQAIGLDVGGDTSRFARAHGYVTHVGTLEEHRFDSNTFDGVFIWNCFEQIADPKSTTLLGHANFLGFPHLYGYSAQSLDRLLSSCGFAPVAHYTDGHISPGIRPLTVTAKREAVALADELRLSWLEAVHHVTSP